MKIEKRLHIYIFIFNCVFVSQDETKNRGHNALCLRGILYEFYFPQDPILENKQSSTNCTNYSALNYSTPWNIKCSSIQRFDIWSTCSCLVLRDKNIFITNLMVCFALGRFIFLASFFHVDWINANIVQSIAKKVEKQVIWFQLCSIWDCSKQSWPVSRNTNIWNQKF